MAGEDVVFRRSFRDPWVYLPLILLLPLALIFLNYLETLIIGVTLIILAMYWIYSRVNFIYIVNRQGLKIYRGKELVKNIGWEAIKKSNIRVRGGKIKTIQRFKTHIPNLSYIQYITLYTSDIGTIDFIYNNILLGRVRGVKVYDFLNEIVKYISKNVNTY